LTLAPEIRGSSRTSRAIRGHENLIDRSRFFVFLTMWNIDTFREHKGKRECTIYAFFFIEELIYQLPMIMDRSSRLTPRRFVRINRAQNMSGSFCNRAPGESSIARHGREEKKDEDYNEREEREFLIRRWRGI
jgi:hypothetical protein